MADPDSDGAAPRPRALVIDDDSFVRSTVAEMLEAAGFDVRQACDGDAGLKLFDQHRPALVITDVLMPNKEGIETILELRRRDPALRIVAMSGGGGIGAGSILDVARKLGANAVLRKPFTKADLLANVRALPLVK